MGYERFTDRARKVMVLATQEGIFYDLPELLPATILVGICRERSGNACNIMRGVGIPLDSVICQMQATYTEILKAPRCQGEVVYYAKVPHSVEAKAVIAGAIEQSNHLRHNYVGTEHLLLGLLAVESPAERLLSDYGLTSGIVKEKLVGILEEDHSGETIRQSDDLFCRFAGANGLSQANASSIRQVCGRAT